MRWDSITAVVVVIYTILFNRIKAVKENIKKTTINQWISLAIFFNAQIYEYSQLMDDSVEREISSDVTLKIIDMILVNETSLNNAMVRKREMAISH